MAKNSIINRITGGKPRPTFFDNKPKMPTGKVDLNDILSGKVDIRSLENQVRKDWNSKPTKTLYNQSGQPMTRQQFMNLPKGQQDALGKAVASQVGTSIYAVTDMSKPPKVAVKGKYNIGPRPDKILSPKELAEIKGRANDAEEDFNIGLSQEASRTRKFLKDMYLSVDKGVDPSLYSELAYWIENASDEAIMDFYREGEKADEHKNFYKVMKSSSTANKNQAFEQVIEYIQKFEEKYNK